MTWSPNAAFVAEMAASCSDALIDMARAEATWGLAWSAKTKGQQDSTTTLLADPLVQLVDEMIVQYLGDLVP